MLKVSMSLILVLMGSGLWTVWILSEKSLYGLPKVKLNGAS
jgi:hypothetical protein